MNRGLLAIIGLVLGFAVVTSAFGQAAPNQRKTLSQRMADMRRSWTQDDEPAPAEKFPDPQQDGNSLIPNWLSGSNQKKTSPATPQRQNQRAARAKNSQQQPARAGQTGTQLLPSQQRTASPQGASAAQGAAAKRSNSSSSLALPGLGGSPLPSVQKTAPPTRAGSNSNTSDRYAAPETDPDYPVIRDSAPQSQASQAPVAAQDTPRHSPPVRTPRNMDARNFRRELSGSFSPPNPVASTAEAGNPSAASEEPQADAAATTPEPTPADSIAAPDATDSSNVAGPTPRAKPANQAARGSIKAFAGGSPTSIGASDFVRSPRTNSLPDRPSAARSMQAFGEATQSVSTGDPSVLVSQQTPVISADIRGPKTIIIGRESVYRVRLQNHGTAAAEGIVATVRIPVAAEIAGATPTQGSLQPAVADGDANKLEWQLSYLEAHGSEVLDIRLVPKESKPLELGVHWTVAPVGSRAVVEVQEPQLKIEIGGPTEVMYDVPQMFRLTLSNPGTGPAEKVRIELVPPGTAEDSATSHDFGDLAAGESRSVDIELTPREAGKLVMKAKALAEGGLASDVAKEIFCRKPELEVDWRGPTTKYAGTPATYFFRVRNPGTAPAEDVTVKIELPQGAEFISGSDGQQFNAERGEVTWRVGSLNPGDDNYMELKCVVNAPGANRLKITAANAAGDIATSSVAETTVEALADLKLTVSDPSGPVAVGSQALYEIHVENRGAEVARDVHIVALFSEGIEPDASDSYSVADGRVSFSPIKELPAGGDVKLRVRARALQPGTHVFRAEVLCTASDIKLAAEETTRFYADELAQEGEEAAEQTANRNGFETSVR